jgi:hypothetical protein
VSIVLHWIWEHLRLGHMPVATRDLLKRKLNPTTFNSIRSLWWYTSFYVPRKAASSVVRRTPVVEGRPSELTRQLEQVNVFAPTEMCRVMTKYGSDKGRFWHNYTTVYSELFGHLRNEPLRILELGLGTNNPELASSMGAPGRPGASLRGWRELFPRASVFGADIDRDILFVDDRIQTFYCDQLDSDAIRDLWSQPAVQGGMDIIIDDGLHTFAANQTFLAGSLTNLRAGGVYIVEDILREDMPSWREKIPGYAAEFTDCDVALVTLPNDFNDQDNNLFLIRKRR